MKLPVEQRRLSVLSRLGVLALALLACAAFAPAIASAASSPNTALLNGESVTTLDGIVKEITPTESVPISLEQYAAEQAGFTVTVKTGAEWEAMTPAEYASYQVLIVGDPKCSSTAVSGVNSAPIWTPVVMGKAGVGTTVGNRVVVGTDPEYHYANGGGGARPVEEGNPQSAGAEHLVQDGIAFAGQVPGATGVYFDTSCTDIATSAEEEAQEKKEKEEEEAAGLFRPAVSPAVQEAIEGPDGRDLTDVLRHLTTQPAIEWSESAEAPACGNEVRQIATNPVFHTGPSALTDENIEGWECSAHVSFTSYPSDWTALAITLPETGGDDAADVEPDEAPVCGNDIEKTEEAVCGQAYVLVAGGGVKASSPNLTLTPETETNPAGGTHTVTATVTHEEIVFTARHSVSPATSIKKPLEGAVVGFALSGTNDGVVGMCTFPGGAADPECKTNANGEVQFTYPDTNGAGEDTIYASLVLGGHTETATASETWTAVAKPAAPAPTTPPATTVISPPAKGGVLAFGTAHLASSSQACLASSSYLASVSGKDIASVTFSVNGHKLKTLSKASNGKFSLRVSVPAGKVEHLSIHVAYTSATSNHSATITRRLARCAAVKKVSTPRFTG